MPGFKVKEFVEKYGIENCYFLIELQPVKQIFLIKYTTTSDPHFPVLCKISEERYKVENRYKITLTPAQDLGTEFEKKHFYQDDLDMLVDDGFAVPFVKKQGDL